MVYFAPSSVPATPAQASCNQENGENQLKGINTHKRGGFQAVGRASDCKPQLCFLYDPFHNQKSRHTYKENQQVNHTDIGTKDLDAFGWKIHRKDTESSGKRNDDQVVAHNRGFQVR